MKPGYLPTLWPPAPAPPWASSPVVQESQAPFQLSLVAIILATGFVIVWLMMSWQRGRADRAKELHIRRKMVLWIGTDASWLTSAEIEKRLVERSIVSDATRIALKKLAQLEQKRFGRPEPR